MKTIRMIVENLRSKKMQVFIEFEAMDFWLDAEEQFELVSESDTLEGELYLQLTDEGITVIPENGAGSITVFQNGIELECGHKRPDDW